ncbi:hypothetical protein FACS1894125_3820 [Actinomycetota bacterium]|nr:hypothetical protein FACS1894125_3820 [Actinomycetota bacterium]
MTTVIYQPFLEMIKFLRLLKRTFCSIESVWQKFYAVFDEIEKLHAEHIINDDGVYYEVSRALKDYGSDRSGQNLKTLTKRELDEIDGIAILHETIEALYVPEFQRREELNETMTPTQAIEFARNLLRRW